MAIVGDTPCFNVTIAHIPFQPQNVYYNNAAPTNHAMLIDDSIVLGLLAPECVTYSNAQVIHAGGNNGWAGACSA